MIASMLIDMRGLVERSYSGVGVASVVADCRKDQSWVYLLPAFHSRSVLSDMALVVAMAVCRVGNHLCIHNSALEAVTAVVHRRCVQQGFHTRAQTLSRLCL